MEQLPKLTGFLLSSPRVTVGYSGQLQLHGFLNVGSWPVWAPSSQTVGCGEAGSFLGKKLEAAYILGVGLPESSEIWGVLCSVWFGGHPAVLLALTLRNHSWQCSENLVG